MKYLHLNDIPWNQYELIGFDMDGTLYDEQYFIKQVYDSIASYISLYSSSSQKDICNWMFVRWKEKGSSYPFIFSETLKEFEVLDERSKEEECLKIYRAFNPKLELYSKVVHVLKKLANEKTLFLVTDGYYYLQQRKFIALNLNKWFSDNNVIFTGKLGIEFYKPSIEAIKYISCLKNTKRTLYVGDRDIDEKFAYNAGFDFLKVEQFNEFWEVK